MYKDIIFLDSVTTTSRQKVLNFINEWQSPSDHLIVNTSGSTGNPKEIKLLKQHIKASAKATVNFFNLKKDDTLLVTLSPDYIAGKMMLIRAIEHQLKIVVAPFSGNPLTNEIPFPISFAAFVPYQVQQILANPISKKRYEAINKVIIGGAKINLTLEKELQQLSNANFATFGMTETISHIALRNITKDEPHYTTLQNIKVSLSDKNCLIINAPNINPSTIITTDNVKIINDSQFIWLGRSDLIINSGGIKFNPESIEQKIEAEIPNHRFYITSEPCDILGEKIILIIEAGVLDIDRLKLNLQKRLTKYELPKSIYLTSQFKETPTQKIIRS